jgi:hypothetical protein
VNHPLNATTQATPSSETRREGWRAIQFASGPQAPDERNKDGRRRGLILAVVGALAFWTAVERSCSI